MLILLLTAISILATASLLAWLFILMHPARPWDFQPVADDDIISDSAIQSWPAVTVLVPSRNEAESLPKTLPALLGQDYPGELKITVVDDRSSDSTAEVARGIAAKLNAADRLTVLAGQPLPQGWVGKMWALDQGARHSAGNSAAFVLLTDADILHAPQSLRRLVAESLAGSLALNSRMARLRCESAAEKLLIPPFVYFFNLLYPMRRVNNPRDPLAAAAGGCVLLSSEALQKMGGGFEPIKSEIIDDVNLARTVKGFGLPIRLSLSRKDVVSLREYPRVADIWKMVSRTAFTELKYSWLRLVGAMLGLGLLFIVPIVAIVAGLIDVVGIPVPSQSQNANLSFDPRMLALWPVVKGALSLLVMQRVFAPAVDFFGLPRGYRFTLPVAGLLYGLMTFDSALRHARGERPGWRDKKQF